MKYLKIAFLLTLITIFPCLASSPHNLLPRLPQIVFDKGTSDMFCVDNFEAIVDMQYSSAQTQLKIDLRNASDKQLNLPLKIRVLYPVGKNPVSISINNKKIPYNKENTLANLNLAPNETAYITIKANVSTDYSVNNVKKAIAAQQKENKGKLQSIGESFARYFNNEVYGTRFMTGIPVSKWGIFPVEIKKSNIEINAPNNFILISEKPEIWKQTTDRKKGNKFVCDSVLDFETTVFLPAKDEASFKENLKLLESLNKR